MSLYPTSAAYAVTQNAPTGKPGKASIQTQFDNDDGQRQTILDEARECARLTIPAVLPPRDQQEDYKLPENFQSLGSRGIVNISGKVLLGAFPPDRPWVQQELAPEILYDPNTDPDVISVNSQRLFMQDVMILTAIEGANAYDGRGDTLGFRTVQRQALDQVFVTGDTLERIDDDFRITVFRRDRYVTRRTHSGSVCYHIVWEAKDPLELSDEQIAACGMEFAELQKLTPYERTKPLYTRTEWQPRSRKWLIEQEFNGHIFNQSEEPFSRFISVPFSLSPGENYGRGLVAANKGDLSSFDALSEKTLDFAAAASKHHPILDPGSELQEEDLLEPSGTVLRDRVVNGVPQNVGFLQTQKLNDFQIVHLSKEQLRADLGKSFLIGSEAVRNSERTTFGEIQTVTLSELQGALGGFYAPVADRMQLPLFQFTRWMMQKRNQLPTLPDGAVKVRVLAGIEALAREARAQKLITFTEVVRGLEGGTQSLNMDVLFDVLARLLYIHDPGIIKTPEQKELDRRKALLTQAQAQANEKAIDVAGNIIESGATGSSNGSASGQAA